MSRTTVLIGSLLIATVGFTVGRWSAPESQSASAPEPLEELPSPRENETAALLEAGAKDIASTADAVERQRKSEELLEKLVKLFMIDVSLRLQKNEPTDSPQTVAAHSVPTPPPQPQAPAANASPQGTSPPSSANQPAADAARRAAILLRVIEAESPIQLRQAMNDLAQMNPMPTYENARTVTESDLEVLMGRHEGQIELFQDRTSWRLTLEISRSTRWTATNPSYRLIVRIRKGPNSTSASTGDGPITQFRMNPGDSPPAYFVDFNENALQLYPKSSNDGFVGLYLESKNRSPLTPVGRITLNRR